MKSFFLCKGTIYQCHACDCLPLFWEHLKLVSWWLRWERELEGRGRTGLFLLWPKPRRMSSSGMSSHFLWPILWSDWPWLHLVMLSLSVIGQQNWYKTGPDKSCLQEPQSWAATSRTDGWSLVPSGSTLLIGSKKHLHFDKSIFLSNLRRVQASLTKQGQHLGTLTTGVLSVGLSEAMHLGFFPLQFIITITTLTSFASYDITTLDQARKHSLWVDIQLETIQYTPSLQDPRTIWTSTLT